MTKHTPEPVMGWSIFHEIRDVAWFWLGTKKPKTTLLVGERLLRVRITPVDRSNNLFDKRIDKLTAEQRLDIASLECDLKRARSHKEKREIVDTIAEILYPERLGKLIPVEHVPAKRKRVKK